MLQQVRVRTLIQLLTVGVAAALLTSCGDGAPKLYPVKGQVLWNDQPAAGAQIVFHPVGEGGGLMPSGKVGEDGAFTLTTYPHGDGAPAGEYIVVVTWYPPDARSQENPQDKLKGRYADPTKGELKATVKPEPNELPAFRLKK